MCLFLHSSKTHLSFIKIAVRDETFVVSSRCRRMISLLLVDVGNLPFVVSSRCRRMISLLAVDVEDLPFVVSSRCRRMISLLLVDVGNLPFVVSSRCLLYCWILSIICTISLQHSHQNLYNMSFHKFHRPFCKPYSYRFRTLSFNTEVKDWSKQN